MDKQEKLLNSTEKLKSDLDFFKQELKPQITNKSNDDFKIAIKRVDKKNDLPGISAKLGGDIDTI
ncbi:MAG: hypothetical protein K0R09_1975 [Clostridiales bacterium]|jgi:hypothetical protein|nr:hypothetical protein [Clostridiales bacterium]